MPIRRRGRITGGGRYAPTFLVEVRNIDGVIANLHAGNEKIQAAVRKAQVKSARKTVRVARRIAPASKPGDYPGAGTQRLRRSIGYRTSDKGLTFQVLAKPETFAGEGFTYYAWWVHEGTSKMPARPFMRQAYEILKPEYSQNIREALREALR